MAERKRLTVLVCGGRDFTDRGAVFRALNALSKPTDEHMLGSVELTVIAGGAAGADSFAIDWAVANWSLFREFNADWRQYGKAAGPIRNRQMLAEGKPDLVLAFPTGGPGTADMVSQARKAGVEVREYKPGCRQADGWCRDHWSGNPGFCARNGCLIGDGRDGCPNDP